MLGQETVKIPFLGAADCAPWRIQCRDGKNMSMTETIDSAWRSRFVRIKCPRCLKVKQDKLEWLAVNPFYSKRFAFLWDGAAGS
jgi:hypothetical protein